MESGEKKPRLPRYKRAANPPPVTIGPREQAMLEAVYTYRYLTRNQIVRLLFNPHSATWVDDKLKRLYHNEYLERIFKPVTPGSGAFPAVYCLDRRGRDYLAELRGLQKGDILWKRAIDTQRELLFLDHTLRINDFRIAMDLACQKDGLNLEWVDERTLKGVEYKAAVEDPGSRRSLVIVPDGYIRVRAKEGEYCLFLEIDNGSQEKKAVRRKVRGHILFSHGPYQNRYKSASLTVLMVSSQGGKRLEELLEFTREELKENGQKYDWELFLFASLEELTPENVLRQMVWRQAGVEERCSLLQGG